MADLTRLNDHESVKNCYTVTVLTLDTDDVMNWLEVVLGLISTDLDERLTNCANKVSCRTKTSRYSRVT